MYRTSPWISERGYLRIAGLQATVRVLSFKGNLCWIAISLHLRLKTYHSKVLLCGSLIHVLELNNPEQGSIFFQQLGSWVAAGLWQGDVRHRSFQQVTQLFQVSNLFWLFTHYINQVIFHSYVSLPDGCVFWEDGCFPKLGGSGIVLWQEKAKLAIQKHPWRYFDGESWRKPWKKHDKSWQIYTWYPPPTDRISMASSSFLWSAWLGVG